MEAPLIVVPLPTWAVLVTPNTFMPKAAPMLSFWLPEAAGMAMELPTDSAVACTLATAPIKTAPVKASVAPWVMETVLVTLPTFTESAAATPVPPAAPLEPPAPELLLLSAEDLLDADGRVVAAPLLLAALPFTA